MQGRGAYSQAVELRARGADLATCAGESLGSERLEPHLLCELGRDHRARRTGIDGKPIRALLIEIRRYDNQWLALVCEREGDLIGLLSADRFFCDCSRVKEFFS